MGNHAVFYPVRPGTNVLLGQIVTRTFPSSEFLSATSRQQGAAGPGYIDQNLAWIEMPPGGWVDGEFSEPGASAGEHAYAIFLKPSRNGDEVQVVSESYDFNPN